MNVTQRAGFVLATALGVVVGSFAVTAGLGSVAVTPRSGAPVLRARLLTAGPTLSDAAEFGDAANVDDDVAGDSVAMSDGSVMVVGVPGYPGGAPKGLGDNRPFNDWLGPGAAYVSDAGLPASPRTTTTTTDPTTTTTTEPTTTTTTTDPTTTTTTAATTPAPQPGSTSPPATTGSPEAPPSSQPTTTSTEPPTTKIPRVRLPPPPLRIGGQAVMLGSGLARVAVVKLTCGLATCSGSVAIAVRLHEKRRTVLEIVASGRFFESADQSTWFPVPLTTLGHRLLPAKGQPDRQVVVRVVLSDGHAVLRAVQLD